MDTTEAAHALTAGAIDEALQSANLASKSEMIPAEFSRYPSYKPSGVEWLGDVPAHWEVQRLKTLAANVVDQTAQRHEQEMALALEHVESWSGPYTDAGPGLASDNVNLGERFKNFRRTTL